MSLGADDLVVAGLIDEDRVDEVRRVAARFQVALTDEVAALIDCADANDPIAAQFVPSAAELETADEEQADPIGDERWSPVPGIVHRYPDRVLLKPSLVCPVYCRYCFRREQIGVRGQVLGRAALDRAYAYIRERPEIWEVVVTGGDPLLLSPRRIATIVRSLAAIDHIQVIRFHQPGAGRRPQASRRGAGRGAGRGQGGLRGRSRQPSTRADRCRQDRGLAPRPLWHPGLVAKRPAARGQ